MDYDDWEWSPYVTAAERRRNAQAAIKKRRAKGLPVSPVQIAGRKIAKTFWGVAWCDNLERYSDYANRLPRGRTYVRNGSVFHLEVSAGNITALVSGSSVYTVSLAIDPLPAARWKSICGDCAGGIDSLVELLQGKLSESVMARICRKTDGLFPAPSEIHLSCSCPDWAGMCKHVAAVLYGVGARLDEAPELLFLLRGVDQRELIATAEKSVPMAAAAAASSRVLDDGDLSGIFGLDLATEPVEAPPVKRPRKKAKKKAAPPKRKPTKKR